MSDEDPTTQVHEDARKEVAETDLRRAEETEAKAEQARKEAEAAEKKAEQDEAEARSRAEETTQGGDAGPGLSAASVTSPGIGLGTEPRAAASAAQGATASASAQGFSAPRAPSGGATATAASSDDPFEQLPYGDRPELQAGIAFASTFLFAKILKSLGS